MSFYIDTDFFITHMHIWHTKTNEFQLLHSTTPFAFTHEDSETKKD